MGKPNFSPLATNFNNDSPTMVIKEAPDSTPMILDQETKIVKKSYLKSLLMGENLITCPLCPSKFKASSKSLGPLMFHIKTQHSMNVISDDMHTFTPKGEPKSLIPVRPKVEPGNSELQSDQTAFYDPYNFVEIKEIIEPGQIVKKETIRKYFNGGKYVKCSLCSVLYKPRRQSVGPFSSHLRHVHQIVILESEKSFHSSPLKITANFNSDEPIKTEIPGKFRDYEMETFDFPKMEDIHSESASYQRTAGTSSSSSGIGKVPCLVCQTDVLLRNFCKLHSLNNFFERITRSLEDFEFGEITREI